MANVKADFDCYGNSYCLSENFLMEIAGKKV